MGIPSSGHRSATGVALGVGDAVGEAVGDGLGDGEAVGEADGVGDGVGDGGGGEAITIAITPPMTSAATAAAPPMRARRERSSAEKRDELGVGGMRRILVCGGWVTMGRMAYPAQRYASRARLRVLMTVRAILPCPPRSMFRSLLDQASTGASA